jgi:hypothetical protein
MTTNNTVTLGFQDLLNTPIFDPGRISRIAGAEEVFLISNNPRQEIQQVVRLHNLAICDVRIDWPARTLKPGECFTPDWGKC